MSPGDKLDFLIDAEGRVVLRPATLDVRQLKGMLKRKRAKPVSLEVNGPGDRAGGCEEARMIGTDTNLLVRYLMLDDPAQSKKASAVIEKVLAGEAGVFINHVVLCEVMWVLDRAYGFPRATLEDVMEKILQGKQFDIEDKPPAWQALNDFKSSRADYADCLIGVKNRKAGCTTTLTLDRATSALSTCSAL